MAGQEGAMKLFVEDLAFDVEKTRENEAGEIEILDTAVLRRLSGLVFHEVDEAFLVEWEEEWDIVLWWDADDACRDLMGNQISLPVRMLQ